ncbi:hypothetical protein GH714_010526 [Hevea brasiliensis]|uniref:beta-carotene 3-hydroxylase n=1 Tax=Hevea brasiliensis TaxID=3981 RepID=A0A6A6MJA2_HEVBR|nr:hypothetical protein GH714_010526 [Hevea brasiliensis]
MEKKPGVVLDEDEKDEKVESSGDVKKPPSVSLAKEKRARKKSERYTYLAAAILSSVGITSMAAMAIYYRFSWQMEGGEFPALEMFGTFVLSVGAAVGMEFWARWAHKALWHASLWKIHESHHRAREGPIEMNDAFAIINAVPAIGLLSYGLFNKALIPGLCFGAGLGITVFGMAYMFVHDGLIHVVSQLDYCRRPLLAKSLLLLISLGAPPGLPLGLRSKTRVFPNVLTLHFSLSSSSRSTAVLIRSVRTRTTIAVLSIPDNDMLLKPATVATSTPKKQENNDSGAGTRVLNEKTDPIAAFSRPPSLPPVLGPLVALSLFEMWSSHDGDDD